MEQSNNNVQASNLSFYGDNRHIPGVNRVITNQISDDLKIIKIKGVFECNDNEAFDILEKIKAKETFLVSQKNVDMMMRYGIDGHFETLESIENKRLHDLKLKAEIEQYEKEKQIALDWFEKLPEEEKNYVEILAHNKFILMPS